jgi:hypothetical protein
MDRDSRMPELLVLYDFGDFDTERTESTYESTGYPETRGSDCRECRGTQGTAGAGFASRADGWDVRERSEFVSREKSVGAVSAHSGS